MNKQEVIKKIKDIQFGRRVASDGEKNPETKAYYSGSIEVCNSIITELEKMDD